MSTRDVFEYLYGEYQDITLAKQAVAGTGSVYFTYKGIDIAGYNIKIYTSSAGTTQLTEGTDYTLKYPDNNKSASEQEDIYAGFRVDNATYQSTNLYLSIRCIGGYTKYTGGKYEVVTTTATITPKSFGYAVYAETGGSNFTLTIDDAERKDDEITIFSLGGGTITLSGTGISDTLTNRTRTWAWDGSEYRLVTMAEGITEEWENTTENPIYGVALSTGELFLDGTDSLTSSDNRKPVVDNVDYIPAVETIDGVDYEPAESKWPGDRGTYGFFGEYENEAGGDASDSNATSSVEGVWAKVLASAGAGYSYASFSALSNNGECHVFVRKGNTATTVISLESGKGSATITWATPSISYGSSATDAGSVIISDELILLRFKGGATGATRVRLYSGNGASSAAGDYTYYKDWQVVDLDYPVPYTPGTHSRNKLQYDIDWATSDEWTIEGWVYIPELITTSPQTIVQIRAYGGTKDIMSFRNSSSTTSYEILHGDSSSYTITTLTGSFISSWNYYKIIITSATSIDVYINGGGVQSITTDVLDLTKAQKVLHFGLNNGINSLNGYMSDIRVLPTADTSTTHYTADLPYYNPDKTYGKNALWSIDDKGHFSGLFDNAGRIIEEYELDGQHVTKWDTGLMLISFYSTTEIMAINGAYGSLYLGSLTITLAEAFSVLHGFTGAFAKWGTSASWGTFLGAGVDSVTIRAIDVSSRESGQTAISFLTIGRWK